MTPAIRLLKKQKIAHEIHEYHHDPARTDFGAEAAEALGIDGQQIFKTLLVTDGAAHYVAVIPVDERLNLKKVAAHFKAKKLAMTDPKDAERITGYIVGGISPIAQKKRLKTVIHSGAQAFELIYISGGRRGCDIAIRPDNLVQVLDAGFDYLVND